jgi:PAS domain S-box-containing protein
MTVEKQLKSDRKVTGVDDEIRAMFAAVIESSDDAIISLTLDGTITSWNPAAKKMFGYFPAEAIGRPVSMLFPSEQMDQQKALLVKIAQGEHVDNFEALHVRKDGKSIHVSTTFSPIIDPDGKITGASRFMRVIAGRKGAEAALRESQALYHSLVDQLPVGVFRKDVEGRYVFVNPWFCRLKGVKAELFVGKMPREVASVELAAKGARAGQIQQLASEGADHHQRIMQTGQRIEVEEHEVGPDGKEQHFYVIKSPILEPDGKIVGSQGIIIDITENKKLEAQFRQSQKLEAVGRLAGGVAHDFNNILAVIQMQADLLKVTDEPSPAALQECGREIAAATLRATTLTRQLLMFSRNENIQQQDLDLNESLNNMSKLLRRTLGEDVQLLFKFSMQPMHVRADPGMMDQVLINLAVNARDAMPRGGQLVIETAAAEFDEHTATQSARIKTGSFVCLSVSDTGSGIRPEHLPRIFEPFFTTKEVGKGTGLGLATVFGIVEQHQGWINVYSEVGQGTTFRIYLPRLAKPSAQKPKPLSMATLPGGNETILLVEDDSFVCASVRNILSKLGYRVLDAINGVEALKIWKQYRNEIHLVLTDLVMPGGINGKELGEQLLQDNPNLKIIYTSGYSAEVGGKDFPLQEGVNFLAKPYQANKLAQTIRTQLKP